jgi:hypothetical protein
MASGYLSGIKWFILWDYPRASWQYDVIVALIVAFIFLTPREFFRDQPRASNIVRLPSEQGTQVFWVEPELLDLVPEPQRGSVVERILRSRFGERHTIVRLEPIKGNEGETKGYMAYSRP